MIFNVKRISVMKIPLLNILKEDKLKLSNRNNRLFVQD